MSAPLYVTRLSARADLTVISPPFADFELADGDTNVWRHIRPTNPPGEATSYTDWNDGGLTVTEIFNPVLSPDETQIAYVARLDATGQTALYVCDNAPSSPSTLLEDDANRNISSPMWSPDSSKLVFTRGIPTGNNYGGTIETIPATGGSPTVLYTPAANFRAMRPAYSFDGDYIGFILQDYVGTNDGLWVMEDDGSNDAEIDGTVQYTPGGEGSQFGWANSERTLAYYDSAGGTSGDAWTIAHDGTGKTQLSVGSTSGTLLSVSRACWRANDSEVFFGSDQGGGFLTIYSSPPTGGGETLLHSDGPDTQSFLHGIFVYRNRLWFIHRGSSLNTGVLASCLLDGTDWVEELDVNDSTLIDWFGSGTGFEFQ